MNIGNIVNHVKATLEVEVEGYFVERFINLCKLNSINIWNVQTIIPGKIRFFTTPKEIESMELYLARTKCKLSIIKKQGVYFSILKYRKRRVALIALVLVIGIICGMSTFIWDIEIQGNSNISSDVILQRLSEIGIYKGKNKLSLSESKICDYIRSKLYEVAWVGTEIDGTTLNIQIVEKVISNEMEENKKLGDIVAKKDAVITKIVANKGTAKYKLGSYIEKGSVAIEGKMYVNNEVYSNVKASGILRGETTYEYENEYSFKKNIKEYTGKKRYGISIGINNKKISIKYLPKDNNYDISSKEKLINIFGVRFSLSFDTYDEYVGREEVYSKEQLICFAKEDEQKYLESLKKENIIYISADTDIEELDEKIIYRGIYKVEEDIAEFVEVGE